MKSEGSIDFGKAGTAIVEICTQEEGAEVDRRRAEAVRTACRQILNRGGFKFMENRNINENPESGT